MKKVFKLKDLDCANCAAKMEKAISRLEGIRCGFKGTSCPDQLAKALKEITVK